MTSVSTATRPTARRTRKVQPTGRALSPLNSRTDRVRRRRRNTKAVINIVEVNEPSREKLIEFLMVLRG